MFTNKKNFIDVIKNLEGRYNLDRPDRTTRIFIRKQGRTKSMIQARSHDDGRGSQSKAGP